MRYFVCAPARYPAEYLVYFNIRPDIRKDEFGICLDTKYLKRPDYSG
jgi:hypothetical protein